MLFACNEIVAPAFHYIALQHLWYETMLRNTDMYIYLYSHIYIYIYICIYMCYTC